MPPPAIPILAQSENKSKFLERLGISDQTEAGKRLYSIMKEEAIAGRARMSANPNSLLPRLINDPNVRPPYSNTQISEAAMHRETLYIFETARPETRPIYEKGHYVEGGNEENWIIKWLLWHVFRYRDNRNRGRTLSSWADQRTTSGSEAALSRLSSNESFPGYHAPSGAQSAAYSHSPNSAESTGAVTTSSQSPARPNLEKANSQETNSGGARGYQSQGYWDPVRDAQRTNR